MAEFFGRVKSWDVFTRAFWLEKGVIPRWQLLAVYLLIVGVFFFSVARLHEQDMKLHSQQVNTQAALCSLRGELEQRVRSTETFLNSHPQGAFGLSPSQLRKSENDTKRTIQ